MNNRGQAGHLFIYVSALLAVALFAVAYIPLDEAISIYLPDAMNATYANGTIAQNNADRASSTWHGFAILFLIAVVFTLIYNGYTSQVQ
jgi:hypothetical protein